MARIETEARLAELDHLLNDPTVPLDAGRVWSLAVECSDAAHRTGQSASVPRHQEIDGSLRSDAGAATLLRDRQG